MLLYMGRNWTFDLIMMMMTMIMIAYMYCLYSSVLSLSSIRSDIEILTFHGLISSGGWDVFVGDRRSISQQIAEGSPSSRRRF